MSQSRCQIYAFLAKLRAFLVEIKIKNSNCRKTTAVFGELFFNLSLFLNDVENHTVIGEVGVKQVGACHNRLFVNV